MQALRVVLATVGSRGDVQPMLAIAQLLVAHGHTPVVAAPPNFEVWVRSLGFEFAPLGADMQVYMEENRQAMGGNPLKMVRGMSRYFSEQIPLQVQQLVTVCQGAQAILWGGIAVAAPSVAEHLRLPLLGVLYTTCMLPSSRHPPPMVPWHGMPDWMNDLLWRANRLLGDKLALGTLNAARSSIGLPPVAHLRSHITEDCPLVIAADETLFPPDPEWQGRYPFANFIYFDDPTPLDPELDAWLADGEPPVFVGFGSMSAEGTDRVGKLIVEAVSATDRRCIVGAGWGPGWAQGRCRLDGASCARRRMPCCSRAQRSWYTTAARAPPHRHCAPVCRRYYCRSFSTNSITPTGCIWPASRRAPCRWRESAPPSSPMQFGPRWKCPTVRAAPRRRRATARKRWTR